LLKEAIEFEVSIVNFTFSVKKCPQSKVIRRPVFGFISLGSTYLYQIRHNVLPPLLLDCIRFGMGGGSVLLLITTLSPKREFTHESRILGSSFLGILLSGIGIVAVRHSIHPHGHSSLIIARLPLWVFVLDFFFFSKQRPSLLLGMGFLLLEPSGFFWLLNPFDRSATEESIPFFRSYCFCGEA
jgi:hypothetical protein